MRKGLDTKLRAVASTAAESHAIIDHDIARELSAQLVGDHRLAFARSFTHTVIRGAWQAADLQPLSSPDAIEMIPLSRDAALAAERLGTTIGTMPAEQTAYIVGTVYTTALPEHYRAAHGIFYTPPELVERLLAMSEEAGVTWSTC